MGIKPNTEKLRSRQAALEVLYCVNKDINLKEAFECKQFINLPEEAKPFTKYLVTQTLRYQNALIHIFELYLQKKPQNKAIEFVYTFLSLGACELLLSQQKTNITLSSYTEITKIDKKTTHLSGIIRAILGKIDQNRDSLMHYFKDYKLIFGDIFYNDLLKDYPDQVDNICEGLLCEPVNDVLKLTECSTPENYTDLLPNLMRYQGGIRPENTDLFINGDVTIQSYASHLPIYGAGDIAGKTLLDLCAAPGGKTLQAIAAKADVTAVDISRNRLERLYENLERTHLNAKIITADVLNFKSNTLFDIILLDAPCTATGTIRKNPDIIQSFTLENADKLVTLQKNMLNYVEKFVKIEGLLIYAVCSLSKSEGENQVDEFIKNHPNFQIIMPQHSDKLPKNALTDNQCIRLLPHHDIETGGHDGFFVAYLRKIS
ncbi:MAG: 16S rRNA (cytosine967-C5)-methyltransferase [Alphaproteobacteria bacterium]|jgi:16S rRNA (cytosine967-C5)-methyltransferase